jgi:hypothetical protein
MNSVVSPKMTVAPRSTSRSDTLPITILDAKPDVASDAPHLMPIMNSLMSAVLSRWMPLVSSTSFCATRTPSAMAFVMPPSFCILIISTGFPVLAISSTTLATFVALAAEADDQRRRDVRVRSQADQRVCHGVQVGESCEQPCWCMTAAVPSVW